MSNKNKLNIVTPNIVYDGIVSIRYIDSYGNRKSIKKHNTGQIELFTGVVKFLAGDIDIKKRPIKLMAFSDTACVNKALSQPIAYASKPLLFNANARSEDEANTVQYIFAIPLVNIKSEVTAIKGLELLSSDDKVCAKLSLASNQEIDTNAKSNILVYWNLVFSSNSTN